MSAGCPLCGGREARPRRGRGGLRLFACGGCGSLYLDEATHPYEPERLYDDGYFAPWEMRPGSPTWELRRATAAARVAALQALGASGRLLDVGCAGGYLVAEAVERGFDAQGIEISQHAVDVAAEVAPGRVRQGTLGTADLAPGGFGAVTAFDLVEHDPEPVTLLGRIHELLGPGGFLAATVPDLSSFTGRVMGGAWPHLKEEHRFYPTRRAFRRLLERCGFSLVHEEAATKQLSLTYLTPLLERYPVPMLTPLASLVTRLLPRALREARFAVTIGERFYVARKAQAAT